MLLLLWQLLLVLLLLAGDPETKRPALMCSCLEVILSWFDAAIERNKQRHGVTRTDSRLRRVNESVTCHNVMQA